MGKVKRLICVEVDNKKTGVAQSNKFYNMTEMGDGTFTVEYGRVGKTKVTKTYQMREWDKILRSKLKKYDDVTDLHVEEESDDSNNSLALGNSLVDKLINTLQSFAGKAVKANYKISAKKVTPAMVDRAQKILDELVPLIKKNGLTKEANDKLLNLYKTIPRQMDNVKNYLIKELATDTDVKKAQKLIGNEQDTLDTMSGQVKLQHQQSTKIGSPMQQVSILEKMGLTIEESSSTEFEKLRKSMKETGNRLKRAYNVVNLVTQKKFDANLKTAENKKTDLFFHGSRNQNWFNIIQTGLLIRPAGSIHNGSMFGDGIYGANKAKKAMGYTSLGGSYWTKGNDNKGFIAVFEFHVGVQKRIDRHDSSCYSLNKRDLNRAGFHSVHARAGQSLLNDEFIIYDNSQCTIKYLLELE